MKREFENPDLRAAFGPVPESCHDALMDAARSVREEKQVKKASMRAVLIAAVIIIAMTAVAFAAGSWMGWTDFLGDYSNVGIPQDAVEQMQVTEDHSWQVGPLTFSAKELLTDGHIAISSIHARMTDGSTALFCADPGDVIGCNGENGRALAAKLGVDPMTPYTEAAKQLNLPLYWVRGILELDAEYSGGAGMEDPMWNDDGSMTYFSMLSVKENAVKEELPVGFFLRVSQIDPETGEETEKWIDREQKAIIPVSPLLEERTYVPEQEAVVAGHTLKQVTARRYVTGAYLTLTYDMDYMSVPMSAYDLYSMQLRDGNGEVLPDGMNLSGSLTFTIEQEIMIGVDKLPDVLTLEDGTKLIAE